MKAILVGILASLFFAVTFVLNRAMELSGGSWYWSASLRFIFMVPFLLFIVMMRGKLTPLLKEMRKHPLFWLKWSFVGFVLFYAPITFAAAFGPGWLVAGTWQITIVAGVLLSPFFYETKDLPGGPLACAAKDSARCPDDVFYHSSRGGDHPASARGISICQDAAFQCIACCHRSFCLSAWKSKNARQIRREA